MHVHAGQWLHDVHVIMVPPIDAGIAMSSTYGVAKKANAIAVRVLDNNGTGNFM